MTMPGGKYAIGHFEIHTDGFGAAWNTLFGEWMPESGYQPAEGPCFKVCKTNCHEHPEGKHVIDIFGPVAPL
ncbi:MAG: GyrI-like domain-containing protein [candidate division KSB1 bacterium]|nr:GyrI-like domain-containing protein [candidate division KSB1 bacterium]